VTLCGVSIGAAIALIMAGRRNARVASVVAINPYDYANGRGMARSSMFLMPRLVSPELPAAFAVPTAYGDLTAAENAAAAPMVWLFNIVGLLDLIYANISTFKDHVDPTYLGVSYYLAVLNVPAMVVVHVVIFAYLLRRAAPNQKFIKDPILRRLRRRK
jgi:pimeloyl-ACP methyl ester carboxylesterase